MVGERLLNQRYRPILERAGELLGFDQVVGEQGSRGPVGIGLGFGRQQIAADPQPDRRQRSARDIAALFVLRRAIDDERFERLDELRRRAGFLTWKLYEAVRKRKR